MQIFVIFFYVIIIIARAREEAFASRHKVRVSLAQIAYSPFAAQFKLKSLEYNLLRFNVGRGVGGGREGGWERGGKSGRTQITYLHRERCNTHTLEAIFSLPTRGYNVFLGTLINSIHFAQRFLITHCTEP